MTGLLLKKNMYWLIALVVVAIALWFRLRHLTLHPLWLDEGYSAYAADKGFDFIFKVLPGYETHPPFYSAILSAWVGLIGKSLLGFRALGAVAGIVALPVYWFAGKEAGRALGVDPLICGFATLMLAAVLPAIVDVTQSVRPYALIALVYAIGIWTVLRLARIHGDTKRLHPWLWAAYLACLALLCWLHNLGSFYAASLGLGMLILIGPMTLIRDHTRAFFLGHIAVALVVIPAFLILLDQAPTWTQSTWLKFRPGYIGTGLTIIYGIGGLGGLICAGVAAGTIAKKALGSHTRPLLALATMAMLPVLLSLIITIAIAPIFLPRTLVSVSIALILLIAAGAASQSIIARTAFIGLLALSATRLVAIQNNVPPEHWYDAVAWLKPQFAPGDVIYAYPNEGALPLFYALRDKQLPYPIRAIPTPVPAKDRAGWYPTGSRGVMSLPQFRLEAIAADAESRKVPTIWLLRLGPAAYDKGDGFVKALSRTRKVVGHWHEEPIDIIGLRQSPQITPP